MSVLYHIFFPLLQAQEEVVALGGDDFDPSFRSVGFIIVFVIFVFLLLFHFYNLFATTFKKNGNAHFFLATNYKMKQEIFSCYLIRVEAKRIDVITSVCLQQGSDIEINLGCIPGFNQSSPWISGTVSGFKPVQGASKSFVISVKVNEDSQKLVSQYLLENSTTDISVQI